MKTFLTTFFSCAGAAVLIAFSSAAKQGAAAGLALCFNVLIVSIFPFLVLSNFIASSSAAIGLARLFAPVTRRVFKLPAIAAVAIVLGLFAGYPAGAAAVERLFEQGDIDSEQAKKLMHFCVCGGLPFIVTVVGQAMLYSKKAGVILFASNAAAALVMGVLVSVKNKAVKNDLSLMKIAPPASQCLITAVEKSGSAMLNICAYVVLFAAADGIAKLPKEILPLLEITNGLNKAANAVPLSMLSAFLAFGGVCIHFQLLETVKKIKMPVFDFITARVCHGALSYGFCSLILHFCPIEQQVFSNLAGSTATLVNVSVPASILMVLMSVVMVFDIDAKKKRC